MVAIKIAHIEPGSLAERLGLRPGEMLMTIAD